MTRSSTKEVPIGKQGQRPGGLRVIAGLLVAVGLASFLRIGWVGFGPPPDVSLAAEQITWLERSIEGGGDNRMQAWFPKGFFFMHALTGMTVVATAGVATTDQHFEAARSHLAALDSPESIAVFVCGMEPEHGIFHAGWSLALAVDIAEASGQPADVTEVQRRAAAINEVLIASPTGFPASYPNRYWPCDAVVAASALARAASLTQTPDWTATVLDWRQRVLGHVDPDTGLLPHEVTADGHSLVSPRGSSQAIIQTFWPDVAGLADGSVAANQWRRFTEEFVVRQIGLVGVREYPIGTSGPGDVDSGPLVMGISASASAVTLAAARRVGDVGLADTLEREAELLGMGITVAGSRRYFLGQIPIGDAFLAWARTRPVGDRLPADQRTFLAPRWLLPMAGSVALAGFGWLLWRACSPARRTGVPRKRIDAR